MYSASEIMWELNVFLNVNVLTCKYVTPVGGSLDSGIYDTAWKHKQNCITGLCILFSVTTIYKTCALFKKQSPYAQGFKNCSLNLANELLNE